MGLCPIVTLLLVRLIAHNSDSLERSVGTYVWKCPHHVMFMADRYPFILAAWNGTDS